MTAISTRLRWWLFGVLMILLLNVVGVTSGALRFPLAGGDCQRAETGLFGCRHDSPAHVREPLFLQLHNVIDPDGDHAGKGQQVLLSPVERQHGVAAGVKRHTVVGQ